MTIKMILATDEKGAIGLGGKLPWHCKEDLEYFKEQTEGQTVVMGSKTFNGLPFKDGLPKRKNLVMSKQFYIGKRCLQLESIEDFVNYNKHNNSVDTTDIYVIGGKSIYEQLLPYVQEVHYTVIKGEYLADTYMDMSFLSEWKVIGTKELSDAATVYIYRRKV